MDAQPGVFPLSALYAAASSLFSALALLTLLLAAPPLCAEAVVSEQDLKAVLFYKLPLFVYRAMSDKEARLGICALGATPLENAMDSLPVTLGDGRGVDFRMLQSAAEAGTCDFIFIGRSEAGRLESHLRRLGGRRLVTVSDIDGFARAGGMVEFALRPDGSGVQLLINRKAARLQGIEFNAQLLRLARIVEP